MAMKQFSSWSTFTQQPGGPTLIDDSPGVVVAIEGESNGRGVDWSKVHLATGAVLHIYEDVATVKTRLAL